MSSAVVRVDVVEKVHDSAVCPSISLEQLNPSLLPVELTT